MKQTSMIGNALRAIVLFAVTAAMTFNATAAHTNGLAVYYPFSGNANDASGNGKHGVNNGAMLVADRFGAANSAYSMSGGGHISLSANRPITGPQTNFSISIWFRANDNSEGIMYAHRAAYRDIALNWSRGNPIKPGAVVWEMFDGNGAYRAVWSDYLPTNNWIHCVGTYNGSTQAIYINGVLKSSAQWTAPINWDSEFLSEGIGDAPTYGGQPFKGEIDDVRVYQRALSASDVAELFALESPPLPPPPPPAPSDLAAYYPFSGNANDASGNGKHGVNNGATFVTDRFGVANSACSFDGNGFISLDTNRPVSGLSSNFTISVWFRANNTAGGDLYVHRAGFRDVGMNWARGTPAGTGGVNWNMWDNGGTPHEMISGVLPTNQWIHCVGTFNGQTQALYVNGVLSGTLQWTGVVDWSANYIGEGIGGLTDNAPTKAYFFNGSIDDVRVYQRALSASDVAELYALESQPPCVSPSGLVGWWKGESNALDSTGSSNGTLVNAANYGGGLVGANAFQFDGGAGKINLGDPEVLKFTNSFTLEAWIYPTGLPTGPHGQIFFRGDMRGCVDPYYLSMQPNGAIRLHVEDESGVPSCGVNVESAPVPLNVWHHVAGVFDGNSGKLQVYVNGALAAETTTPTRPFANLAAGANPGVSIGNHSGGFNDQGFNGRIDEVSAYNRALGSNEIAAIHAAGSSGKCLPQTACDLPDGIAAWWKLEGNGVDSVGTNAGTLLGEPSFTAGKVAQAMTFDGVNDYLRAAPSPSLDVGGGPGMTIEGWIRPASVGDQQPIVEWNDDAGNIGAHFWISVISQLGGGPGSLWINLMDTSGQAHQLTSATGLVVPGSYQHVAMSYDKASGAAAIYLNGVAVAQTNLGTFTPDTRPACYLGYRSSGAAAGTRFQGGMDEISIYGRALAAGEIAAIHSAGASGKCPPPEPPAPLVSPPVVTDFTPKLAEKGVAVVFTGTNFSPVAASNIVYFGAVRAQVTSASSSALMVTVPAGATYGPPSVTVAGLTGSASKPFVPTFNNLGAVFNSNAFAPKFNLPAASQQIAVAVGDLDGDGRPDVVAANVLTATVSVYRNLSDAGSLVPASFAPRFDLPTGTYPYSVALGDVDGDGKLDLIVGNNGNGAGNTVSVFRNLSAPGSLAPASFAPRVNFTVATGPTRIAVGDLDHDGRQDLAVITSQGGGVSVLRNTGVPGRVDAGSFAPFVHFPTGPNSWDVKIGDLDGDGKRDLVASSYNSFAVSVLHNISSPGTITSNSFAPKVDINLGTQIYNAAIGDLDGDGKPDLTVTLFGRSAIALIRNLSVPGTLTAGSFATPVWLPTGSGPRDVTLGDVDGDGRADIVACAYNAARISVLRNQAVPGALTPNSFAPRIDFVTGVNPAMAALGDLNGDGRPDIVSSSFGSSSLAVLKNMMVPQPPLITQQPTSQIAAVGETIQFSVSATSTLPLSYQWFFYAEPVMFATNATLRLENVQLAQAGSYSVRVINAAGVVASDAAQLSVFVPECVAAPNGLVAWLPLDGDGVDSTGLNSGALFGGPVATNGRVNLALQLDGQDDHVKIRASSSTDVGSGSGMSIEMWIKPDHMASQHPLVEWNNGSGTIGAHFWISVNSPGSLFFNLQDTTGGAHQLWTAGNLLRTDRYQHVAMTYDKLSGWGELYLNGSLIVRSNLGSFTPDTLSDAYLGLRPSGVAAGDRFRGAMDEVSLYNRALSSNEINAIYAARGEGKCPLPPTILAINPPGTFVNEGSDVSFTAVAAGSPPLGYQWQFAGTDLLGATNATLALNDVVFVQAGTYTVVVTGPGGVASSNAVLAVNRAPVADARATEALLISPNGSNAVAVLDGSLSSDPDGDALTYAWFRAGESNVFATGVVAIVNLPLGSNALTLAVTDGMAADTDDLVVEVITTAQAVDRLALLAQEGDNPQPLLATLRATLASIDRSQPAVAINQLEAFKNKVLAQVMPVDPDLAAQLLAEAQAIIDALNGGPVIEPVTVQITAISKSNDGKPKLAIRGNNRRTHVVEMSTNLLDWAPVGVAGKCGDCAFEFEDGAGADIGARYYRVVSPK